MVDTKVYKPAFVVLTLLFITLTVWWVMLASGGNTNNDPAYFFAATYGLTALVGGLYGLFAARSWGYLKSAFGRAIIALSLGLLMNEFGQVVFSYFNVVEKVQVPYPSLADIGFFGAVPLYMLGGLFLMQGLGVAQIIKRKPWKAIVGVLVPLVVLGISYLLFLNGQDQSQNDVLTIFLNFGYPLGQAAYVSIALVIVLSLQGVLGGKMKWPIMALLLAFLLQYAADFNFLYQTQHATWANGAYGDYLYLVAYFVMGISLVAVNRGLSKGFAPTKIAAKEAA